MKFPHILASLLFVFVISGMAAPSTPTDNKAGWKPIDPAHLRQKISVVEKDADAEVVFWEVRVKAEGDGVALLNRISIKVLTTRGCESQGKVEFVYPKDNKVTGIAGRTIKSDGTVIELKPDAIFERTVARARNLNLKSMSFAMPGVEPGSVIEYKWQEVHKEKLIALSFQRNIPIQSVKYYLPSGIGSRRFNLQNLYIKEEDKGLYSATLNNVPAFRKEPNMPPENAVVPLMLIYPPRTDDLLSPRVFWQVYGKQVYEENRSRMKVNDEVRRAAAAAVGNSSTSEEKLKRLFEFCRSRIKNIYADSSALTDDLARWKENKTPADTLKRGMGTGRDIDFLFAALATAAGFDARYAIVADRSKVFFNPGNTDYYFLDSYNIAVRVDNEWHFFDPASPYVPYGMLRWQEEGQYALICDSVEPLFVTTPHSAPEKSLQKRSAMLHLNEDGSLEGEVRIELTGHFATESRDRLANGSSDEQEEALRESIKIRMSTAEVSNFRVENALDPIQPFVYTYHVRIPGYAQRTGKRLFLQPAFFQNGLGSLFPTSERRHPVYFHYPWSEDDTVNIEFPIGYAVDSAESPVPLNVGEMGKYEAKVEMANDGRMLQFKRTLFFGRGGAIYFTTDVYAKIKQAFDIFHQRDSQVITLKQSAVASRQ